MIGLPNPWVILGAIAVAVSVYFYGHHKGWDERDREMQAAIAQKNEESRQKELALGQALNDQSYKLKEANDAVSKKQTDLDKLIRAGRVRLPAAGCVQTNPSPAVAAGGGTEARAEPNGQVAEASESERQTLAAIAEIVAAGDRAINQLNACIDAYNQVRESVNGQR
jgi:hypothetical protein